MKDIRDYLHLYLMCKYQWRDGDGEWRRPEPLTAYQLNSIRQSGREVRLILRPLSDMTEEEAFEFFGVEMNFRDQFNFNRRTFKYRIQEGYISVYDHQGKKWYPMIKPGGNNLPCFNFTYAMAEVVWLLKRGFDVFGLIESGLAITMEKYIKAAILDELKNAQSNPMHCNMFEKKCCMLTCRQRGCLWSKEEADKIKNQTKPDARATRL